MNAKRMLKADPKLLPAEMQENITHAPIDDDSVKISAKEEHKSGEADIRTFTSTDTYDAWEEEHEDYLK